MSRTLRTQTVLNALVGVMSVAIDFAFIAVTKWTIDIATGRSSANLRMAAGLLIAIMLGQIALGFSRKWIAAILGVRSQNRMQQKLFRRILGSEWNGTEHRHSGDVLNRLERDVNDVTNVITETIPAALGVTIRLVGAFFFLYSMDRRLACLLVIIVPVFVILSRFYVHKMRALTHDIRQTDSQIQSILTESVQNRMVLKTLERTTTMAQQLEQKQAHLRRQIRHRTLFSSFSTTLLNMGFATGYLVAFLWGVNGLYEQAITYGTMIAFIQLVGQIQGPFREMTKFVPLIIGAFTASERLMELEEIPLEEQGSARPFTNGAGLRISNVTYSYTTRRIIKDFSFEFPIGSTTAILGETGAGKTTLIRLILALLKPQQGTLSIFDADGREETITPMHRCNLTYVPQGNTLFSGTIRYNLLLGNPDATEEEMVEALHMACADYVMQLPQGLDTLCGEGGTGLSEGQAQRIAVARALLKKANILLLDEATSALDTETESRLLQNLTAWMQPHQTLLFVTHRPAVIEHCTQVLRLERNNN